METTAAMYDSPRTTVRRFFEALNRHEIARSRGIVSDKLVVRMSGADPVEGREAVKALQAWSDAFPDGRIEVTDLVVSGNTVVAETSFSGTHEGVLQAPGLDVQPTGRRIIIIIHICWIVVRAGRVESVNLHVDRLALREELTRAA